MRPTKRHQIRSRLNKHTPYRYTNIVNYYDRKGNIIGFGPRDVDPAIAEINQTWLNTNPTIERFSVVITRPYPKYRRRISDLQVDDTPILFKDPVIVSVSDENERANFIEGLKDFVQELRGKK
jgi:hypothetical protein|nr:MAG TPA: hypothetical protein [Bacteriophage sp.]